MSREKCILVWWMKEKHNIPHQIFISNKCLCFLLSPTAASPKEEAVIILFQQDGNAAWGRCSLTSCWVLVLWSSACPGDLQLILVKAPQQGLTFPILSFVKGDDTPPWSALLSHYSVTRGTNDAECSKTSISSLKRCLKERQLAT